MLLSQRISLVTVSIRVAAHVVCKRLAFAFSLGIFVVYLLLMTRPDDESVNFFSIFILRFINHQNKQ